MKTLDMYLYNLANSSKQATILFHLISFLFITSFPWVVISDSRSNVCSKSTSTYTNGSTFSSNLNIVLSDLLKNAPETGYNTSSYGQSPNRIHGLLQCIGNNDVSQEDCSICAQQAINNVRQLCGSKIGSYTWQDKCFLRYENYSFFSELNTDWDTSLNDNDIVTSNLTNFTVTTSNLLTNLSDQAIDPANKGFAQGSTIYPSIGTIYGLVQCLRELSLKDCRSCLQLATRYLSQCCFMKEGAEALSGSCAVKYVLSTVAPLFNTTGGSSTSPPPFSSPGKSSPKTLPITLETVGGLVIILIVCLFAIPNKLKSAILRRPGTTAQNEEIHENIPESTLLKQKNIFFSFEELREATDNFHESKKLGEGGFGSVYKGETSDGKEIAVKKLSVRSGPGKPEFMNEVKLLAKVQHRNLVKLLGCCAQGPERLLVYEYLPNKSLDTFLFGAEKRKHLDWRKRYNIIMGIARGLVYLHEDSHLRIIHRDIKPNNILLDDKLNPKIADFGLARLFPENETHIQTRVVAGTYGYMAPEYVVTGQLSVKVDVYSFGVLILEIVTGRKSRDTNFPPEMQTLLEWAWMSYKQGDLLNMIDSTLAEACRQEEAVRCIHVALLCTQADASIRPTISNVILMISSSSVTLPNPTHPAFVNSSESYSLQVQ